MNITTGRLVKTALSYECPFIESELLQVVVKIVCDLVHEMNPPLAEDVMLGAWIREIV